ncbi:MAG: peptidase U32 family protein [Acutalibacteraceae bacterium]
MPSGDMEKLRMAVAYGADAVYLAGTSFGMRSFTANFAPDELPQAIKLAHDAGVKVHCTVNIMPRNDEAAALPAYLEQLDAASVDALILADLGAFMMAGKYAPHCQRHVSTQQSVANYACAQSWFDLGASRVVLARELSLREILGIRERVSPELELETFCHGAMCVSYSGPLPAQQLYDRPRLQPRPVCPALPVPVRADGGKAPRRIFPRLRG